MSTSAGYSSSDAKNIDDLHETIKKQIEASKAVQSQMRYLTWATVLLAIIQAWPVIKEFMK